MKKWTVEYCCPNMYSHLTVSKPIIFFPEAHPIVQLRSEEYGTAEISFCPFCGKPISYKEIK